MSSIVITVITILLLLLYTERMTGVFFNERQTTLPIMLLTFAIVFTLLMLPFLIFSHHTPEPHIAVTTDIVITFAGFYIILLNYKSSIVKRIVAALSIYAIFALASLAAGVFSGFIYVSNLTVAEDFKAVMVFLLTPLFAILAAALLRGFINIKRNTVTKPTVIITIAMVLLAIFFSFFFLLLAYADRADLIQAYMLIYALATPIGFIVLFFFLFDTLTKKHEDNLKSARQAQEKEYYFNQCQLMQESVENIKSMRHDMKLHLATARDFISTDKTGEATAYLNGLLGDIEESGAYSNTKNTAFDSIINFKLNNAKQENIKLDIRLLIPPSLNIEVADIITIIGNLLDNALDGVSKVEDKKIKLDIEYSRESLFIQLENTFDGVVKYDNKRIATRKNGGEHGHGLKNIRKSVEKYNGHIDITHDENVFSVGVLLYVDDM
ncbi:MAG: ATP-binding protein [Defluviitaleaceae bacterium]|nr:ATP-binding protein [Defluviitaleaceae bacterium]